jgi:hypothetical protein
MTTRYVAYGLQLCSSFPLPGMTPRSDAQLPTLELQLSTPTELDARWSGPGGSPAWRGRLGDGSALSIEDGAGGDTLFTYGERARYRLDAARRTLQCAPWEDGLHWRQTLLGRILPNASLSRGYEALHASAVESPAGVIAVAAPAGMGKTTLGLELMRRGWPLVTDDVLTLADGAEEVRAHPGSPHMNVAATRADAVSATKIGATLGVLAGEHWMAVRRVAERDLPVRMVCLLQRGAKLPLEAQVLTAGPVPLTPYMLGLRGDIARERRRFSLYANLASSATLVRLTCGLGEEPARLADCIELALADSEAVAGGAR